MEGRVVEKVCKGARRLQGWSGENSDGWIEASGAEKLHFNPVLNSRTLLFNERISTVTQPI